MRKLVALAIIVVFILAADLCLGGIPHLIHYQGMLTDDAGNPLNTPQDLTFRIYDVESGGTALWGETQNDVPLSDGLFSVLLGSVNPIDLSFDEDYWLEIEVSVYDTLLPRMKLASVGYAYRAEWADTTDHTSRAQRADTADYALAGEADQDWIFRITDTADTTLMTGGKWGFARYGNVLYGNADSTHVNLGVACTTGMIGQNRIHSTVSGGHWNTASGPAATVGGGGSNTASGAAATVGGGGSNVASGTRSTVPGGYADTAAGDYSVAAGREVRISSDADYTFAFGRDFSTSTSNAVIFHNSSDPIKVGVGTSSPGYTLDVVGDINVTGNVKKGGTDYTHPDYVFEPDYRLMSLHELKKYVFENKSLPNVISAEEVKKNNGFNMDELLIQMLEKIEEQTLYIFELEERIAELERQSR